MKVQVTYIVNQDQEINTAKIVFLFHQITSSFIFRLSSNNVLDIVNSQHFVTEDQDSF
jgi:hypothetical protein